MLCALDGIRVERFDILSSLTCSSDIRGIVLLSLKEFLVVVLRYFCEGVLWLLNYSVPSGLLLGSVVS